MDCSYCGLKLKNNLFLAPMASFTNLAFRLLCQEFNAGLTFTEMVSVTALHFGSEKSLELLRTDKSEKAVGVQFFGNNENHFAEAVEYAKDFDLIDLNFGCPAQKVANQSMGAGLLDKPKQMQKIAEATKSVSSKPVTAKIRLGKKSNELRKIIPALINGGIDAIAIHGRTASQGYSGTCDLKAIRTAKSEYDLPIVANGWIRNSDDVKHLLLETGCGFAMIGREALKNPKIFRGKDSNALDEKIEIFDVYFELCKKFDIVSLFDLKLKSTQFFHGIAGAGRLRKEVNACKSVEDIIKIIKKGN